MLKFLFARKYNRADVLIVAAAVAYAYSHGLKVAVLILLAGFVVTALGEQALESRR